MSRIYEIIQRIKMISFIKLNPQWDIHLTFWVKKTFFLRIYPPHKKKNDRYSKLFQIGKIKIL